MFSFILLLLTAPILHVLFKLIDLLLSCGPSLHFYFSIVICKRLCIVLQECILSDLKFIVIEFFNIQVFHYVFIKTSSKMLCVLTFFTFLFLFSSVFSLSINLFLVLKHFFFTFYLLKIINLLTISSSITVFNTFHVYI